MRDSEFSRLLSIEMQLVERWVDHGWLVPASTPGGREFTASDLARARLLLDLSRDMGVNEAGVDVALRLIDQMHGLRQTLHGLMDAIDRHDCTLRHRLLSRIVDLD